MSDMDPATLMASGCGKSIAMLNKKAVLEVHHQNFYDNSIELPEKLAACESLWGLHANSKLKITFRGTSKTQHDVAGVPGGPLLVNYLPTASGSYHCDVMILCSGEWKHITGSPFKIFVATDISKFPDSCLLQGSSTGHVTCVAGEETQFVIQTPWGQKNQFLVQLATLESINYANNPKIVDANDPLFKPAVEELSHANTRVTYKAQVAGSFLLFVSSEGKQIKDSPFELTVHPAKVDFSKCYVIPSKQTESLVDLGELVHQVSIVDEDTFMLLQECDEFGNLRQEITSPATVECKLKTGAGAPLDVAVLTGAPPGDATPRGKSAFEDIGPGQYKLVYTGKEIASSSLELSMDGGVIMSCPVDIVGGLPCAEKCTFEGLTETVEVDVMQKVKLVARDRDGRKPTFGGLENFHFSCAILPTESTEPIEGVVTVPIEDFSDATITTQMAGHSEYIISFTTSKEGLFVLHVRTQEGELVPGGIQTRFVGGPVSLETTTAFVNYQVKEGKSSSDKVAESTGVGGNRVTQLAPDFKAGNYVTIHIQCRDLYGNRVTTGGVKFNIASKTSAGESVGASEVMDHNNGMYSCRVQITTTGDTFIDVTSAGIPIKDSPIRIVVGSMVPQSDYCVAAGEGLEQVRTNAPATFSITVKDMFGNNNVDATDIEHLTANIAVVPYDPQVMAQEVQNLDQEEAMHWKNLDEVSHSVISTAQEVMNGKVLGDVNKVTDDAMSKWRQELVTATGAAKTTLEGRISTLMGWKNCQFLKGHKHDFDRKELVQPKLGEKATYSPSFTDQGDGNFLVSYTPMLTGECSIDVSYRGGPIHGSPWSILILPGAVDSEWCYAWGHNLKSCVVGEPCAFWIQARDECGNLCAAPISEEEPCPFSVTIVGPTGAATPLMMQCTTTSMETTIRGRWRVEFYVEIAGAYQINACTSTGKHIQSSPFTVNAEAAAGSPTNCVMEGSDIAEAIVMTNTQIKVQGQDRFGNKLSKGGGFFTAKLHGAQQITCDVTDKKNGSYVVSYTGVLTGKYTLNIKLNEVNIAGSPVVVRLISQLDATLNHHNRMRLRKKIVQSWRKVIIKDATPAPPPEPDSYDIEADVLAKSKFVSYSTHYEYLVEAEREKLLIDSIDNGFIKWDYYNDSDEHAVTSKMLMQRDDEAEAEAN